MKLEKVVINEGYGKWLLNVKKDICIAIKKEKTVLEKLNAYTIFGYTQIAPTDVRGLQYNQQLELLKSSSTEKTEMLSRRKTEMLKKIIIEAIKDCSEGKRIEISDHRYANFSGEQRGSYMRRKDENDIAYLKSPAGQILIITAPKEKILDYFSELDIDPVSIEVKFVK